MSDDRPKAPVLTGFDDRGRPRLRGSFQDQYQVGPTGDYRNIGLQNQPGTVGFLPPIRSGNQDVLANRSTGLRNARDTEKQTEMVRGGLDRKTNAVVGPSLTPVPVPDITWLGQNTDWMLEYQQSASSAFSEWATDLHCRGDAEGHYQFGGLMWQAARTLFGPDAEVCGYVGYDRERAGRKGWKWSTFVSMTDPDRLSTPSGCQDGQPNQRAFDLTTGEMQTGLTFAQGREIDDLGAMEAIWLSNRHPAEPGSTPISWSRIPRMLPSGRGMGFHWFFKRRAGMQRALTGLAAVLSTVQMLSDFSTATLQTAVSHAYMAAYLKTTMSPERARESLAPAADLGGLSEWDVKALEYAKMGLNFGGKRIPILGPNDELVFESLTGAAMDFDPFRNAFLRELASALNVSFEQLSLDFSKSSYSSTRASIIEAWRAVTFERAMFTAHIANIVYDAVIEEAFALEILKAPPGAPDFYDARAAYTRCTWIGPAMGWIDPLKEINAGKARVGLGVSTLAAETAQQGALWSDTILQRSLEEKFAKRHKVVIDTSLAGGEGDVPDDPEAASSGAGVTGGNSDADDTGEDEDDTDD